MVTELVNDITVSLVWTAVGLIVGIISATIGAFLVPKIIDKLTPDIDEEKEIKKGNLAVAQYFGLITAAVIIGMMIVIAAAILALNLPSAAPLLR